MTQTIEPPEHPDDTFAPTLEEIEAACTVLIGNTVRLTPSQARQTDAPQGMACSTRV